MVERSPSISTFIEWSAAPSAMRMAILFQMVFAGLVLSATSPMSNINSSNPCTPSDSTYGITIWTQGDADAVSNCSSIFSDFFVDFTFPGKLHLDNLGEVNGNLGVGIYSPNRTYYDGSVLNINTTGTSMLTEVSFFNLTTVDGFLKFESIPTLSNVSIPYISNITEYLLAEDVPNLAAFDLGSNLINVGRDILINGTGLQTLTLGDDIRETYFLGDVSIINNIKLNQLELLAYNISGTVLVKGPYDISFPALRGILGDLTIVNASSISIDELSWVGQSIRLYSSSNYLTNFSAPQLMDFGGELSVLDNPSLNNISTPNLLKIQGGIQILDNPALQNISGFPQLREIEQNVDIEGPIDYVAFPQLRAYYGTNFTVSSSHSDLDCTDLDAYAHSSPAIIRSAYTCTKVGTGPDTSPTPSTSTSSTDSGGLSAGAKAGIAVGVILGVALIVALAAGLFFLRRKRAYEGVQNVPQEYVSELPQGEFYGKAELSVNGILVEADSERPVQEIGSVEKPGELDSRPVDDTHHNHHFDVYEGPTPVGDTRTSPLADPEGHMAVEDSGLSHHSDVHEMQSLIMDI